jgi:hypothetical protein
MRIRPLLGIAVAGLLFGFAAAAGEPSEPQQTQPGEATIEGDLAEPADADDADDIRDDNDPNDVGQEAMQPSQKAAPKREEPSGQEAGPDLDADWD